MNRSFLLFGLLLAALSGCGSSSDIVRTEELKLLTDRCVYVEAIQSEDPYVGRVLRDVLQKEFIRRKVRLCDPDTATIIITGSTFMTVRSAPRARGKSAAANQSIESVSLVAKDREGRILLTASYDNKKQQTVSRLAKKFGRALAAKIR